jgi:hypothetical protein
MSKSKGGGTGRGTGKKGWNRWKSSSKKKGPKPYVSKGTKKIDESRENNPDQ